MTLDIPRQPLRLLLSYWYFKNTDLEALLAKYFKPPYPDLFADSGAFSAMTQGVAISLDEYATWLKRWKHLFSVYANLDVIKDADGTWKNQVYLEDKHGLVPMPVFHVTETWSWLEHYVARYPYIALGVAGMQSRRQQLMAWIARCFKIAGNQSVFHGFALTSFTVMRSFPWYSVDSSSWGSGFRYGQIAVFDEVQRTFVDIQLGDYTSCYRHAPLLRRWGLNPEDFADRRRNHYSHIAALAVLSHMAVERYLQRVHGKVTHPQLLTHGMKVYGVASTPGGAAANMSLGTLSEFMHAYHY